MGPPVSRLLTTVIASLRALMVLFVMIHLTSVVHLVPPPTRQSPISCMHRLMTAALLTMLANTTAVKMTQMVWTLSRSPSTMFVFCCALLESVVIFLTVAPRTMLVTTTAMRVARVVRTCACSQTTVFILYSVLMELIVMVHPTRLASWCQR